MFCDSCGSAMSPEQRFCKVCGKAVDAAPAAVARSAYAATAVGDGRVARHLTIVATLWIVLGALMLLGSAVLFAIAAFPIGRFLPSDNPAPAAAIALFHFIFLALGGYLFVTGALQIAAAWGLLQHANWARILTLVLAFLRLLELPLGTALGIYTIWVLLGPTSDQEYRALGAA